MSDTIKLAVLGGDTRQIALVKHLQSSGVTVQAFGLPSNDLPPQTKSFENWQDAIRGVRAVVLPLPVSLDSVRLHMPLEKEREAPLISAIFRELPLHTVVLGGRFSPTVKALAEETGWPIYDYFTSEELQVKNALPTAEGAVFVLMQEIPSVISGLSVAVTGFGRVSRALSSLLFAMGAEVTVAARKENDLETARALGYKAVSIAKKDDIKALSRGYRVIFNTVPFWIFSEEALSEMQKETLIIDLASSPGGVDANAAGKFGIRVIWALSLPGKYAPESAGHYLAETVLSYLKKEGYL